VMDRDPLASDASSCSSIHHLRAAMQTIAI
jgi:hypothetical protein